MVHPRIYLTDLLILTRLEPVTRERWRRRNQQVSYFSLQIYSQSGIKHKQKCKIVNTKYVERIQAINHRGQSGFGLRVKSWGSSGPSLCDLNPPLSVKSEKKTIMRSSSSSKSKHRQSKLGSSLKATSLLNIFMHSQQDCGPASGSAACPSDQDQSHFSKKGQ